MTKPNKPKPRGEKIKCECKRNYLKDNQEYCEQCEWEVELDNEAKEDYWLGKSV